jgi:hypothetical protein
MDVESASRFLPIRPVLWDPAREAPPVDDGTWDTAVVPTRDWGTVQKAYQWLASGQHPFRSFIIDSISELQQRYLDAVAGRGALTQQDWGDAFRTVSGLVRDIRDLTLHPTKPVECVVLVAMAKNNDGKWRPHAQGQLATTLPYYLDAVIYLYVVTEVNELTGDIKEVRHVLTRPTEMFEAGERVGGKLARIEREPNLEEFIHRIFADAPVPPQPQPTIQPDPALTPESEQT